MCVLLFSYSPSVVLSLQTCTPLPPTVLFSFQGFSDKVFQLHHSTLPRANNSDTVGLCPENISYSYMASYTVTIGKGSLQ